jgi:hypothetical protein
VAREVREIALRRAESCFGTLSSVRSDGGGVKTDDLVLFYSSLYIRSFIVPTDCESLIRGE